MSTAQEIEQAVQQLSPEELAKFRAWYAEYDAELWDQQIEADVKAGRLDDLMGKAIEDLKSGRTTER